MLVDTMTYEEKIQEVVKDYYEFGFIKMDSVSERYARERKKRKIDKTAEYARAYTLRSPSKNYWTYIMRKEDSVKKYKDDLDTSFMIYTHYINKKGFQVFKPVSELIEVETVECYNSHVFHRYAERMDLDFSRPLETVRKFFINNPAMIVKPEKNHKLIGTCRDGLILGDINSDLYPVFKTFISKDLMRDDQRDIKKGSINFLRTKLSDMLNMATFNRYSFGHHSRILRDISNDKD